MNSQQFLKVLREKEEKKKQLEEEKQLRKLERERKRKEKELQKEAVQKRKEERLLAKKTTKTSTSKMTSKKTTPQTASKTITTPSKTITSKRTKRTKYLESSSVVKSTIKHIVSVLVSIMMMKNGSTAAVVVGYTRIAHSMMSPVPWSCVLGVYSKQCNIYVPVYNTHQYLYTYHIMNIENVSETIIVTLTTNSTVY